VTQTPFARAAAANCLLSVCAGSDTQRWYPPRGRWVRASAAKVSATALAVIAWGVVLAAPVNLIVAGWALPHEAVHLTAKALAGIAYIAGISQLGGFVVWYRGMGLIGVARASQLQLVQPLLTLVWAVLLLGEHLPPAVPLTAVAVLACIAITQRARA